MVWLDLSIVCLLLWGGVKGYRHGWAKALRRLMVLLLAAATAAVFLGDMKEFMAFHYPVEEAISALVSRRTALPVGGWLFEYRDGPGLPPPPLDSFLSGAVQTPVAAENELTDILIRSMVNTLAFLVLLALWWSAFVFMEVVFPEGKEPEERVLTRALGFCAGVIRSALLVVLLLGALSPFAWLSGVPRELLEVREATLGRLFLLIFNISGIWWR